MGVQNRASKSGATRVPGRSTPPHPADPERTVFGLGVSAGIAIGPAHVVDPEGGTLPHYAVAPDDLADELARFGHAVGKAERQLTKLQTKAKALPEDARDEIDGLLQAHLAILDGSRLIRGVERRIRQDLCNAELAVQREIHTLCAQFASMDDAYLSSRIQDIRDVGTRLTRNLTDRKFRTFARMDSGGIVLAEEITPADTALMEPGHVGGFASVLGGAEGHTAIMARSLGLPAVLGVAGLMEGVAPGTTVVIDGTEGQVVLNPSEATLARYRQRQRALDADRDQLKALIAVPSESADGVPVGLHVNAELARDAAAAQAVGADGIGLLRTEFLFMNRSDLPDEEEQTAVLTEIVTGMRGKPVTIRTLDVGGEKIASALKPRFADVANPALGLRAIRLSLREPALLKTQYRAMLRAAAHGPVRILLPMITLRTEILEARRLLHETAAEMRAEGLAVPDPLPPLGIMVEVPAAALSADLLAVDSDFFALGTNDLTMYTLAIDRGDDQVASLYDPLHPAVLRLVRMTVDAARRARIPVSVCGEMAGDPDAAAVLFGLGVRELSMTPSALLPVKRRLRALDLAKAERDVAVLERR